MPSQIIPVAIGLATGIGLILAFAVFAIPDNTPQGIYERNLARLSADADCLDEECATVNIAYCEIDTKSVAPADGTYVWIIRVTGYDKISCSYEFERTNLYQTDSRFGDFIIYECRAFAEDLREIEVGNSTDAYIQGILLFYGNRCGISMP